MNPQQTPGLPSFSPIANLLGKGFSAINSFMSAPRPMNLPGLGTPPRYVQGLVNAAGTEAPKNVSTPMRSTTPVNPVGNMAIASTPPSQPLAGQIFDQQGNPIQIDSRGNVIGGNSTTNTSLAQTPNVNPGLSQNAAAFSNNQQSGGDIFGSLFANPKTQQYLQTQSDILTRLGALQGQLAQSQVPGPGEITEQNQQNYLQNVLNNMTAPQYLQDNPSLQAGGITEGQLERTVAQSSLPIQQALSNAILAKSMLAQQRQITGTQLGAEATGLGNQSQIAQQLRQLTMFGGLPPELANTILQKQLFPPFQVTTNIAGQPIVVQQNPGGGFSSQTLGAGSSGFGAGSAGGVGGLGQIAPNQNSISVGGLDVPIERASDGTPYINSSRLSEPQNKVAQLATSQTGVPVLSESDVISLHTIEEAKQNLQLFKQNAQELLTPGLLGRIAGFTTNMAAQAAQVDPRWRQFQTLRAGLIKSVQGIAAGAPGLRVTGAELANAADALPTSKDNRESAMQAIQTFENLLNVNQNVLLGGSAAQSSLGGGDSAYQSYLQAIGQ